MRDLVAACAAGHLESTPLLDLNHLETTGGGLEVCAALHPALDRVVVLQARGPLARPRPAPATRPAGATFLAKADLAWQKLAWKRAAGVPSADSCAQPHGAICEMGALVCPTPTRAHERKAQGVPNSLGFAAALRLCAILLLV